MDDFVERMLKDRRTLHQALVDVAAKYDRIPRSKQRSMLERMIEGLNHEIALRQNRCALLSEGAR
jgi:hypothetical protein